MLEKNLPVQLKKTAYILAFLYALAILASIFSCASNNKVKEQVKEQWNGPLQVSSGSCYPMCPEYTILVYPNGNLEFEGIRRTVFIGKKSLVLKEQELQKVYNGFLKIDWNTLSLEYDKGMRDLPEASLQYKNRRINFKKYGNVPDGVITLTKALDQLLGKYGLL